MIVIPIVGSNILKKELIEANVPKEDVVKILRNVNELADSGISREGVFKVVEKAKTDINFRASFLANPAIILGIPELAKENSEALRKVKERLGGGLPHAELPLQERRREILKTDEEKVIRTYRIEIASKGDEMQVYDSKIYLSFLDPNLAPGDSIEVHKATLYFCPDNLNLPPNRGFVYITPEPPDPNRAPGDSDPVKREIECHIYYHNRKLSPILDVLRNERPVYFYYKAEKREAGIRTYLENVGEGES